MCGVFLFSAIEFLGHFRIMFDRHLPLWPTDKSRNFRAFHGQTTKIQTCFDRFLIEWRDDRTDQLATHISKQLYRKWLSSIFLCAYSSFRLGTLLASCLNIQDGVKKERWKWDTTLMFKTFHVTAHILGSTCQREQVKLSFPGGRRRFSHGLFLICLCI